MSGSDVDRITELLERRKRMEIERNDGDLGNFLFGWQCENPFAGPIIDAVIERSRYIDHVPYAYLEDNKSLPSLICDLHELFGEPKPSAVFCGAGAMSIIFAFSAFLKSKSIGEVYYVPPIYFSFHAALRLLGIRARPVSGRHAFEKGFGMNLPEKETILIVSDPVWYAGQRVPETVISALVSWQDRTNSIIFVDGSFQYMTWDRVPFEGASRLNGDKTIRLISPTKSLAISGYRFAYCQLPAKWRDDFAHAYTNVYGSANVDSIAFGIEAIAAMKARTLTNQLIQFMTTRHQSLRHRHMIESILEPECGFFAFERLIADLPDGYLTMDGDFFDQPRFPGYVRLNLLSPALPILLSKEP